MKQWREQFPILADSTYLVSHSMGAAPLGARESLKAYWDEWASDGPEAWERWLPRIGEIADGIGAIIGAPPGSVFLGPNVSVLQAAIGSCIDFSGDRNEVVYESLQFPSLTYVWREWERYGAVNRIVDSDDGRTIPTERIVEAITEKTALAVLSHAYYVSGALADVRAIQRALPAGRRAALRGRLPDDGNPSIRRDAMGFRHRNRRIAQVALRRAGLRMDLRQALVSARAASGRYRMDGARASVRV